MENTKKVKKIAVIGAGWYGAHIALTLQKAGYQVTLIERKDDIFRGLSGDRGIRLHAGPHYPRSAETRKGCHANMTKFRETYPDLVVPHKHSIYGLGINDADGAPPKVDEATFNAVCTEIPSKKIDPDDFGYKNLISAFDVEEPSIIGGNDLREIIKKRLKDTNVKVRCKYNVQSLDRVTDGIIISDGITKEKFDFVVNSTCFENMLPTKKLPFDMEPVYQTCLALVYIHKTETINERPSSFIVMDGMFPCLMPFDKRYTSQPKTNEQGQPLRAYMLTHAKWTIMASRTTFQQAQAVFEKISDEMIDEYIRPNCEEEMRKFYPNFENEFEYVHWAGSILAKMKTEKEFRGAFAFKEKDAPIAYVFPGKIGCIFSVADEIIQLIKNEQKNIVSEGFYTFVKNGVLHQAISEIQEKPKPDDTRNTCQLQTFDKLININKNLKIINDYKTTISFFNLPEPPSSVETCLASQKNPVSDSMANNELQYKPLFNS